MSLLKRLQQEQSKAEGRAEPPARPPAEERATALGSRMAAARAQVETQRPVDPLLKLKNAVRERLVTEVEASALEKFSTAEEKAQLSRMISDVIDRVVEALGQHVTRTDRQHLLAEILDEVTGFGPINVLLLDDAISEVMVNGPQAVFVEKRGRIELTDVKFRDDRHVLQVIEKIVAPLGRRIDESSPMVDARLPDGSRVNAIIPPLALDGPTITIRKFSKDPLTVDDLVRFGSLTQEMADFLYACVQASLNIVVSGGTGSGKTTLLNVLSSFIPSDERIVTIEDAAELQLRQEHVVRLESRPPNIEGHGAISIRDLVRNALRMRPDRIVVGECRGGEALDMLQAMNTGHDGSLTTGHANSPRDMLARLETMVLMAGMDLPVRAIREQIASAVDLIVQQTRLRDGSRRVTRITEVQGMEGEVITLQDIFVFDQRGTDADGKIIGDLRPTGIRPKFIESIEAEGIEIPLETFMPAAAGRVS